MGYTEYLQRSLLGDSRKLIELKMRNFLGKGGEEKLISQWIGNICDAYGCSYFGFQLIRYLHTTYNVAMPEQEQHTILGVHFPAANTASPVKPSEEDKKRYAQILADLVVNNSYDAVDGVYAKALFETILIHNKFLEKDGSLRAIGKWDVYDVCRMLHMDYADAVNIAFKTFTDGSLSVMDARNLIEKFSFAANLTKMQRDTFVGEYTKQVHGIRKKTFTARKPRVTENLGKGFGKLLNPDVPMNQQEWSEKFMEHLIDETPNLMGYSNTARIIFEQILGAFTISTEPNFDAQKITDEQLFRDINMRVKGALMDFTEKTGGYSPLSGEDRGQLMKEILGRNNVNNLKDAYFAWSVPVWTGEQIKRDSLGSRMEDVLTGKVAVRKEDILIALFIVCSEVWSQQNDLCLIAIGSKKKKAAVAVMSVQEQKEWKNKIVCNRLKLFINHVNMYLKKASLDSFYLAHPTEAAICYAILTREKAGDFYLDNVSKFKENPGKVYYTTAYPSRFGIPEWRNPDFVRVNEFPQTQEDLFKSLDGKIRRYLYRSEYVNPQADLLMQIRALAKKIHAVYVQEQFAGLDVYFSEKEEENRRVCEVGFIPAINMGRVYTKIDDVSEDFLKILLGEKKILLQFRETRFSKAWKQKKKVHHPEMLVEERGGLALRKSAQQLKLKRTVGIYRVSRKQKICPIWTINSRYTDMKNLNPQLAQLVHTRALLTLLQCEIMALLHIQTKQETAKRADIAEDDEAGILNLIREDATAGNNAMLEEEEEWMEQYFPFPVEISLGSTISLKLPALDIVSLSVK